jgi:hypothetical protein
MNTFHTTVTMVAVVLAVPALAMTGDHVQAKFRGTWVPAAAACTSPVKVVIDANRVSFVNGAQRADFDRLEQCFSCMGQGVEDVVLLSTDKMGDSPWTLTLDGSKKGRTVVTADFSNDKRLGGRFPLGKGPLKKCS